MLFMVFLGLMQEVKNSLKTRLHWLHYTVYDITEVKQLKWKPGLSIVL